MFNKKIGIQDLIEKCVVFIFILNLLCHRTVIAIGETILLKRSVLLISSLILFICYNKKILSLMTQKIGLFLFFFSYYFYLYVSMRNSEIVKLTDYQPLKTYFIQASLFIFATSFIFFLEKNLFRDYFFKCLVFCLILSFFLDITLHPMTEPWKGLTFSKNSFGRFNAISFLFLFFYYFQIRHKLKFILICLSIICLYLSDARTAQIATPITLFLIYYLKKNRVFFTKNKLILLFFLSCSSILLVNLIPNSFFELINKDPTFTGRTFLWNMLQEIIKNNLLFGLGYGFYNMDNEIGNTGGIFVEFQNGHNETLSLLTTTGLIGLFFVIIIYIKAISNVFDYIKKTNFSKPSLFFLSCLIFSMILNTTDKTSNSFNIEWFMIILFQFPEFFEKLSAETNFL